YPRHGAAGRHPESENRLSLRNTNPSFPVNNPCWNTKRSCSVQRLRADTKLWRQLRRVIGDIRRRWLWLLRNGDRTRDHNQGPTVELYEGIESHPQSRRECSSSWSG